MRVVFLRASMPPTERNTGPAQAPDARASSASDPSAMRGISDEFHAVAADVSFAAEALDEGLAPERAHDHQGVGRDGSIAFAARRDAGRRSRRCDAPCERRPGSGPPPSSVASALPPIPSWRVVEIEAAVLGPSKPADVIVDALFDHVSGLGAARDRPGWQWRAQRGSRKKPRPAASGACSTVSTPSASSASLRHIACTTPPRGSVECVSMAMRSGRVMQLALPRRTPSAVRRRSREGERSGPRTAA